jgi:hypothetical protein
LLDQLRLEIPAEWIGPFTILPAVEHRVTPLPGGTSKQLIITPQQAIGNEIQLSIRGDLRSPAGLPLRIGNVEVLAAQATERLVVLGGKLEPQEVVWQTRGLQTAVREETSLPEGWLVAGDEVYRVVAEKFDAVASFPPRTKDRPEVLLADYTVASRPGGRMHGQASFMVIPTGDGNLTLEMPPYTKPTLFTINGTLCQCRTIGLRTWRIETNSRRAPVVLDVQFEGALSATGIESDTRQILAPRLTGLPVRETVWTLDGLTPMSGAAEPAAKQRSAELDAELVRLETVAKMLTQIADAQPGDLPAATLTELVEYWRQEFVEVQARIAGVLRSTKGVSRQDIVRLNAARQLAQDAYKRATSTELPAESPAETGFNQDLSSRRLVLIDEGSDAGIRVRMLTAPTDQEQPWTTFLFASGALVATVGLLGIARVRELLAANAPTILALVGLAWWLAGPLAWLGWIAVGLSIWIALRSPWRPLGSSRSTAARIGPSASR